MTGNSRMINTLSRTGRIYSEMDDIYYGSRHSLSLPNNDALLEVLGPEVANALRVIEKRRISRIASRLGHRCILTAAHGACGCLVSAPNKKHLYKMMKQQYLRSSQIRLSQDPTASPSALWGLSCKLAREVPPWMRRNRQQALEGLQAFLKVQKTYFSATSGTYIRASLLPAPAARTTSTDGGHGGSCETS